jgi:5'-methylthioadenosine phosphorylase
MRGAVAHFASPNRNADRLEIEGCRPPRPLATVHPMPDNTATEKAMTKAVIGIIGGSGVYDLPGLEDLREERVETPWGAPSDTLRFGRIGGAQAVFLPRHGRGHVYSPSGINYRANIHALKSVGVTDLVSVSACGSFKPELHPGVFVLADQFVDRTYGRESSFFGNGCVAHVSMAHPVAPLLQQRIVAAACAEGIDYQRGGTYLCMEGPQFSSVSESLTYKGLGYDVIGMTAMPEAKLAREAEMSYAIIAMVTDYDCWRPEHAAVEVASVLKVVHENAAKAARLLGRLLRDFPGEHEPCPIGSDRALDTALITGPGARDASLLRKLDVIMARVNKAL